MKKIVIILLTLVSMNSFGQEIMNTDSTSVTSIDGIVKEVLKIISGNEGKVRDWKTFRNLFLPTAHFTILYNDAEFPEPYETVSLEEFIELMHDIYYEKGFTEYETGKKIDEYNGIAQVFQGFYAKDSEGEEGRGITSYQLIFFKDRWWIANIIWTTDSNGIKVPDEYLEN